MKKNYNYFIRKFYSLFRIFLKNPWNIYSWIKYKNFRRFYDWFFSWKYVYISNERYEWSYGFKNYISNHSDCYNSLVKWLDVSSVILIDNFFNMLNYVLGNRDLCIPKQLLSISNNPDYCNIRWNIKQYIKPLYLPWRGIQEVFFYKHWMLTIPNIEEKVKWKDIIDCGAYIWDSALMFSTELDCNKIYWLEPDNKNYKTFNEVVKKNNLSNKICCLNIWTYLKKWRISFSEGDWIASQIRKGWNTTIEVDSIDNIVKENNINPGLIKRDIEWAEYDSLMGGEKTIKKYKPTLIISIYHNPRDFFEIKPLLESWNLWYKFKIVHCSEWYITSDIVLIAYI